MAKNPLEGLVSMLNEAENLAKEIGTPINEVYSGLNTADSDIKSIENFIGDLNDVVNLSDTIGDLCYALTEIPIVGEVLDAIGTILRDFGKTVGEIIKPINADIMPVLKRVQSGIHKINEILSKITEYLNFFITNLPRWTNTIQVLYFGWQIIQVLVSLLDGTEPAERLEALMKTFDDIGSKVMDVYDAVSGGLKAVWDVVKEVLKPLWDDIKSLFEWFDSIAGEAQKVLGIFHDVKDIVDKVEDAIKPVKWALDAVKCIFEKIFKPVLDWIMDALGLNKLEDEIEDKLKKVLHIDDLEKQLMSVFHEDRTGDSSEKLSSSQGGVSKVHQLDEILKQYVDDPQQALMAALVSALSGTPVIPGSFPPPPPRPPPLNFGTSGTSVRLAIQKPMFAVKKSFQIKEMKLRAISGPMGRPAAFTAIAAPSLPSSPTDWSDVNQFIKDIDSIINSLAPVLSLGTQLTQYLDKAQAQLAIPGQLHTKLSALQTETQFLYDFSSFLQLFPVFKEFLPLLTNGLGGELTNIKSLDSDMSQFVGATSSLSTTLQPIVNAENPTLFATIKQLTATLNNWKSQVQKYQDQLEHAYTMNEQAGGKFTSQVDALATTYHQRVGQLQSLLSQITKLSTTAGTTSHTIIQSLCVVSGDFDEIDPYVQKLEDDIKGVSQLASWAGRLDGIFSPLKCMLTTYKCVGDENNIKSTQMFPFKTILELSENPTIKRDFKLLFEKLLNEFFPVQSIDSLVKTGLSDLHSASSIISGASQNYLSTLTSLQKLQVGKYQFQYKSKKTGKTEIIDNHFFTEDEVQQALQLGQDLSKAAPAGT